jgi:hypothetical protein
VSASELLLAIHEEAAARAYVARVEVLDQSRAMLKVRLYVAPDLYIQLYRNDRFDTTNFVLVYGGRRLYARDQLGGRWHRHTSGAPEAHDTSPEGSRPVALAEFLDEAESVMAAIGLP